MTDVKRWVEDGASESVRDLLAAARDERPAEAGIQRTLVAMGLGSAVATGASHAAGSAGAASLAKGATSAGTLGVVAKWGAIGAVGAMTTFGAVQVTSRVLAPPPASVQAAPANGAPRALSNQAVAPSRLPGTDLAEPPPEAEAVPAEPAPAPAARPAKPAATALERSPGERAETAAEAERILEEVRAIDRARSALARGDGRGTLAALDGYRSGFSERRFEPEALYLRMEALGQLGDSEGARAAAKRLLVEYPNAPQAARARVVAGY